MTADLLRRPAGLLGAVLLSVLAAGCNSGTETPDVVASASASAANEETGAEDRALPGADYAVPVPEAPRDVTALVDDPCGSLSTGDATALEIGVGAVNGDDSCLWEQPSRMLELVAGARPSSLADFYDVYLTEGEGGWEPTQVGGLPAAYANGPFEQSAGACVLLVGLDASTHLRVEATGPDTAAACERAGAAADLVVAGLAAAR